MRTFLALGRYRSLSAASRALQVTHATVARRIQTLQDRVGEILFERRPDGYVLTAAGERVLEAAARMEASAQTLTRPTGSDDDDLRGLVRINAPPALAQAFLLAHLAELSHSHPALDIDLASDIRSISLIRHEADIAVRVGTPVDVDLIAKPVGSIAFGFYGTPARCLHVESGGLPTFISFNDESSNERGPEWLMQRFPRSRVALRAENHVLQAMAARSGIGLALLPHYLGRTDPELRLCAIGPLPAPREIWLLIRKQDRNVAPVRAVMQRLVEVFEQSKPLFCA